MAETPCGSVYESPVRHLPHAPKRKARKTKFRESGTPSRTLVCASSFSAADLQKRLKPLIRKTQPYAKRIAHKGIWVEPKLLAEIEYRAKSAEGKVRHPFFKGLREDL
jgi:bifunctional non-homologous end joining protein LigD